MCIYKYNQTLLECVLQIKSNFVVWFMVFKHHFQQYFSYIMAVSFIGGGKQSTWIKPQTCRKLLTNFITYIQYTYIVGKYKIYLYEL